MVGALWREIRKCEKDVNLGEAKESTLGKWLVPFGGMNHGVETH